MERVAHFRFADRQHYRGACFANCSGIEALTHQPAAADADTRADGGVMTEQFRARRERKTDEGAAGRMAEQSEATGVDRKRRGKFRQQFVADEVEQLDRKSTRLNSSH